MTLLLHLFLVAALVPLFLSTWRMSLFGLALEGVLLAWIASLHAGAYSAGEIFHLIDLLLLRAIAAPLLFQAILKRHARSSRGEVLAGNVLLWAVVFMLVLLAFQLAGLEGLGGEGEIARIPRLHLAVSAAALLLGFLVLAASDEPFNQIVGLLRIENSVALFELGAEYPRSWPVELGLSLAFLLTLAASAAFLWRFEVEPSPRRDPQGALDE